MGYPCQWSVSFLGVSKKPNCCFSVPTIFTPSLFLENPHKLVWHSQLSLIVPSIEPLSPLLKVSISKSTVLWKGNTHASTSSSGNSSSTAGVEG